MTTCLVCGSDLGTFVDHCETCAEPVGKPNVRLTNRPEAIAALDERYKAAMLDADGRGILHIAGDFDAAMKRTVPVINVDIHFLRDFLSRENLLYATYHQGVKAETRKAAGPENDRERMGVDGILFGQMASHIVTAALSLDCRGVLSYGPYCMQIRDVAVAKRASLLEENSFFFVRRHRIQPDSTLPLGYSCDWQSRHKLASAKLISRITAETVEADFQDILLHSSGDRQTDDFIEIHIYGGFDKRAIEKVAGPVPQTPIDIATWAVIQDLMAAAGKVTEQYS